MKAMKNPHYREVENLLRLGSQRLRQELLAEALDCFQRAYRQAIKLADAAVIRSCAFNLGACMVAIGEYERAVRYLQLVLPSDAAEKPVPYIGDVHFNIGVAQERLNKGDAAHEAFRHAYVHYKKNEKHQLEVEVAFRIARYSESQASIQEARAYYKAAMEACRGDPTLTEWRLRSLVKFAFCSFILSDFEPATTLAESIADAHLIPSNESRVAILNEMGIALMNANKYGPAKECFEAGLQSVTAASSGESPDDSSGSSRDPMFQRAAFLQNIASALTALNRYDEAIGKYEEALTLFDASETANGLGRGHCYLNAALCHARLAGREHRTSARQLYEKALEFAKEAASYIKMSVFNVQHADDRKTQWQALEALGAMAFSNGDMQTASDRFAASLALLTEKDGKVHQDRIEAKLKQTQQFAEERARAEASPERHRVERVSSVQGSPARVRSVQICRTIL
uniref:TPR_REGION domain-containing protein n=1 Tax=Macrostomum lignano TaxID=282301 RepID=A0A1I8IP44_9PLAT